MIFIHLGFKSLSTRLVQHQKKEKLISMLVTAGKYRIIIDAMKRKRLFSKFAVFDLIDTTIVNNLIVI